MVAEGRWYGVGPYLWTPVRVIICDCLHLHHRSPHSSSSLVCFLIFHMLVLDTFCFLFPFRIIRFLYIKTYYIEFGVGYVAAV